MVLLQRGGVVGEYRDYRGIPVLAATRFLPQLGWGIVTKVDRAEALAGFQRILIRDIGLALVLIIAIVSLAIAWARQQRLQRLQADLLNRKQTEAHLRQSADRFWAALQNSPVVVFNQDRELRYTWINQPVPPWSEVDYIGKTDEEIIGVTDGGRLSAFKRPVLATGIGVRQEWSFVCQGEKHDYDINVQPLRNNRGEIVGITCASTDITERKRVEEQLRESERKYRRLFETTEAFAQTDMTGKFREANPAYLRMLGYSAAELMELTYEDVTPERWRALDSNMIQNQILRRGYSDLFEKEYRKKDGTVFPVELRGFVVRDEANQPVGTWAVVRDITERKQAEQRLREYERVVEGLEEMIVVIDRNYRYQLANQAFLNYRGLKREQVIGRSVAEVLNKEIFENILKVKLDECLQGKVVTFSMKYVYPKLGERDLYLSYFPIEGHNGFDRIACVLQDITDRKRAENALRESETRYRLLFERNPAAVYRCTLEGKLLDCNEAFARIAGCESREDALRFPVSQFYLPPETRASVVAELRERGSLGDFELCAKRKDGTPVWILANLTFLAGENGGPDLLEGAFVDITDRKNAEEALQHSEAQLRAFIENAPYGVFRYAKDRFLSANPALVRILGYNTEAEVTALNLATNVFSEASECRDLLELSRQRATFGPLQAQWKCRDGRSILVRFSGRLAPAPQNGHLIVEAIVEDITQQRSIEEHLRQADKMEALSRLATGIAHDFNNLLLGITLNLEHVIAGTGVTDTPLRQELEETLLAAKNAAVITRQLLAFGRKREMQPQSVNLNDVVTRSQDLLARLAGGNIYFNMRLDHKLGTAMADPVQIQQVILNLVVNARDALPGGGQITVKTANIKLENPPLGEYFTTPPNPGSYVVLEVTDNGSGISKEALSHVFEPFFTTKLEGSGLGLSTSHGIASQSSGYMSVRSQPGRGTTVKFYLPRGDERSAARQTA